MEAYTADMEIDSVETQPSRPSTSRRNTDRPPKLRSSCDICANAKVKCDRERPVCQRCLNSGMRCNYSISRRMGKPPASARKDNNQTSTPKQQGTKSSPRRSSGLSTPERDSHKSFLNDQQLGGGSIPDHLNDAGLDNSLLNYDHSPSLPWNDLNFMTEASVDPNTFTSETLLSTSALLALEGSMNFMDNWGSADHGSDLARVSSGSTDQFHGSDLEFSPSFDVHGGQSFCTTFNPSSGSDENNPAAPSTIDQVLATNRRAITTFHQLLQCPCSSNSGLVLAIALIILKILSCYGAIGRSTSSRTSNSRPMSSAASGSSTPWGMDTNVEREMVLDIPITMGAYQIDSEDEQHLKLQLVLNELRKVSKLIDAFAGRYCRGGPGGDGIYGALEKFLRGELRNATKEVSTALRSTEEQ
ncbi:hypothetical protein K432DRAFT_434619 [Lepidopterella palustris CBS 459.81]|uniref:Zn(2)-C6 fungal-type domain-containing protein n=1 Tax=Lepidopterella palustris CBS 459.81 TaxID=1314670 RepID=A0A8E2JG29_9PEZI|nr:hypothetical protein K432DRAFT_434619 [Lepidopterella palustris CBS 459.81]